MKAQIEEVRVQKRERLKNLDIFVLDNSLRESTVGQLRSHTLENKIKIYEEVKKCGFKDIIVAAFAHMTRVDDDFCQYLIDRGEDFSRFYILFFRGLGMHRRWSVRHQQGTYWAEEE